MVVKHMDQLDGVRSMKKLTTADKLGLDFDMDLFSV